MLVREMPEANWETRGGTLRLKGCEIQGTTAFKDREHCVVNCQGSQDLSQGRSPPSLPALGSLLLFTTASPNTLPGILPPSLLARVRSCDAFKQPREGEMGQLMW